MERKQRFIENRKKQREIENSNRKSMKLPISKKWVEVKNRDEEERKQEEKKDQEIFKLKEKQQTYGKEVKRNFWPEISKIKQEEIKERKLQMNMVTRRSKDSMGSIRRQEKPNTSRINNSVIMSSIKHDSSDHQTSLPRYKKYKVRFWI